MASHPRATRFTLSSPVKRAICLFLMASAFLFPASRSGVHGVPAAGSTRPRIVAIASVTILVTDLSAANDFYRKVILLQSVCTLCKRPTIRFFAFPTGQKVELLDASPPHSSMLSDVSFVADDLKRLAQFLEANRVRSEYKGSPAAPRALVIHDPDGHQISFIESPYIASTANLTADADFAAPVRITHAGLVVHDRTAADHFYKDVLGFRLCGLGGMKDDTDDRVAMQVPDGTDWIEYMLNVPASASKPRLGAMSHIAFGVADIHATRKQLLASGAELTEEPRAGRDGTWQMNLYDPDETRLEFMESSNDCGSSLTTPVK